MKLGRICKAAVLLAGAATPVAAQESPPSPSFLQEIGGSADVGVVGRRAPEARPLVDNADEVAGARFFEESGRADPMLVATRALQAFETSCVADGGQAVPQGSVRTRRFYDRVLAHLTRPTGAKDQWRGLVAICDGQEGPIGGVVAILHDNSGLFRAGNPMAYLLGAPTTTAVYAFRPDRLPTRAQIDGERARSEAMAQSQQNQAAEARLQAEDFRKKIAVGDETNCGTVIDVRGPMVEIAVPATRTTPNGQSTFWSRVERVLPPGYGVCSFGL